jgi:hypothetical protein
VVHGIGEGNRADGWSNDVAKRWSVQTHEVTFREAGRTWGSSFVDFASKGGDWAKEVQSQIKDIVQRNPGRRVILVSHSWGTVTSKLALAGGTASGMPIPALEGVEIEEWITLGSPLGRAESAEVAGNLRQLNVEIAASDRPSNVKHWTNFYDPDDQVSNQSHHLAGADNIEVGGSGYWADVTGLSYHSGIWQNRRVNSHVWDKFMQISNLPPLLPKPSGGLNQIAGTGSVPDVVTEYRTLLPRFLQADKKPWHTHIELVHNATPVEGNRYRVNWVTWCLIENGPDKGKDYQCFENDSVMSLGQISQATQEIKNRLKIK